MFVPSASTTDIRPAQSCGRNTNAFFGSAAFTSAPYSEISFRPRFQFRSSPRNVVGVGHDLADAQRRFPCRALPFGRGFGSEEGVYHASGMASAPTSTIAAIVLHGMPRAVFSSFGLLSAWAHQCHSILPQNADPPGKPPDPYIFITLSPDLTFSRALLQ